MNPNSVRYFLAIVRFGTFRRTGDALRVAASAINRQISLLEKDLGAELFVRGRGRSRLRLTAAGEIFLLHARSASLAIDLAREQIEALKGLRGGTILLGAAETFARDFLPGFLVDFNRRTPRISFHVSVETSPRLIERLLKDEIEIALVYNPGVRSGISIPVRLFRRTCMMMRADHPLANKTSVTLSDYARYPIVLPAEDTSMRELYDQVLSKFREKPQTPLVTTSYEMMRSAARVGIGLAIVNEYLVSSQDRDAKDVVFVPIADSFIKPRELACCVRAGRKLSVATTVFVERIREAFHSIEQADQRRGIVN